MNEFQLMQKAKEMADSGCSRTEIVLAVRHDETWVAKSIQIMSLPQEIVDFIQAGKMSRAAAEQLITIDKSKVVAVFRKAKQLLEGA